MAFVSDVRCKLKLIIKKKNVRFQTEKSKITVDQSRIIHIIVNIINITSCILKKYFTHNNYYNA